MENESIERTRLKAINRQRMKSRRSNKLPHAVLLKLLQKSFHTVRPTKS